MTASTREQLLDAAEGLFADKGFYGASIATIARELGLTKQALLHHFGSKEKLYGEVLQRISDRLTGDTEAIEAEHATATARVEAMLIAQYRAQMKEPAAARLIMRELLDNEQRAEKAGNWYLKPYLEALVTAVQQVEGRQDLDRPRALALVYQLLGAAHYFAVSQPTLTQIFGRRQLARTRSEFEEALRRLIRAALA